MVKCPNCSSENPDYAFFCSSCATELKDRSGRPYVSPPPAKVQPATASAQPPAVAKKHARTANPLIGGACVMIAGALAFLQGADTLLGDEDIWGLGLVVLGLGAILFGLRATSRTGYQRALIGAVMGIAGLGFGIGPFFALGGLVLIALSREEFEA